ncbi:oxidoreductase [Klebsiella pneumoniae subsp. ozaenae]|uniref:Oxidoreductase n=1 Tax=Klebsiella pneumoniae subsp. ozaenae TaxID=574 RepID=A0A378C490_KLEPO|nr:oxidoreductase [Klebsiella pneumoniae subsp. ozaenae]
MHINYLEDDDLVFLPECSEAHLEAFTRILTHGENGKPRLSQHAPAQRDIFSDGGAPGALSPQLAANRR